MILTVHVKPRAKKNAIVAWLDETTLKISVTAAPERGKANDAVIKVLAEAFHVAPSTIEIVRGATTTMKQVRVPDTRV